MPYHIEKNTVQETLVIPLYGLWPGAVRQAIPAPVRRSDGGGAAGEDRLRFFHPGAEVRRPAPDLRCPGAAMRQNDLVWEVRDYLNAHPRAAVINLGAGWTCRPHLCLRLWPGHVQEERRERRCGSPVPVSAWGRKQAGLPGRELRHRSEQLCIP